jgi:formiminoglutamase
MLEHVDHPLVGSHYVCLGVQPAAVSREHFDYVIKRNCVVKWSHEVQVELKTCLANELSRHGNMGNAVYLSVDADVVHQAEVPGVSAPNAAGLGGPQIIEAVRLAGQSRQVTSLELVEINPHFDVDGRSSRWAALVVWHFLMGLADQT